MKADLHLRKCSRKGCTQTFKVMKTSKQKFCCQDCSEKPDGFKYWNRYGRKDKVKFSEAEKGKGRVNYSARTANHHSDHFLDWDLVN